jgi:hypothetical protein
MPVACPSRSMRLARAEHAGFAVALLLAAVAACNPLAKKNDAAEAGAPAASAPATSSSTPGAQAKSLDATACNPGTSLDPPDKGKTIQSDHFKYTLLDARTDTANVLGKETKVVLVKLQVENVTNKPDLNTSIAEVDVTRDKAGADRVKERDFMLRASMMYPRPKMCVDLGGDVGKGKIPPGTKVIGYYAYELPDTYKSLWFSARNISPEAVGKGDLLKVVGSFRLK